MGGPPQLSLLRVVRATVGDETDSLRVRGTRSSSCLVLILYGLRGGWHGAADCISDLRPEWT